MDFHSLITAATALTGAAAAVLFAEDVAVGATPIAVVTTAETLVAVGVPLPLQSSTGKAAIVGLVQLTVGTGTTAVTLRIYRGATAAGGLVATGIPQAGSFTVGSTALFTVAVVDPLNTSGGAQYCMTVQATGASANGSVVMATLNTKVLSG
jgi:hypothetical protein